MQNNYLIEDNNQALPEQQSDNQTTTLNPGEKVFTVVILLICLFFCYRAWLLWQEYPSIDGPAIFPLVCSGLSVPLLLSLVISNIWKSTPVNFCNNMAEKQAMLINYLFCKNVDCAIVAIVIYCVLLQLGTPFYVATFPFLWGMMSFFAKKNYVKNALWSVLTLAFIDVAFRMVFSIILP